MAIRKVSRPRKPGVCIACKNGYNSSRVALTLNNREIPRYGSVTICSSCVKQAAQVLGYPDPGELERLRDENRQLADEVVELRGKVEAGPAATVTIQFGKEPTKPAIDALLKAAGVEDA